MLQALTHNLHSFVHSLTQVDSMMQAAVFLLPAALIVGGPRAQAIVRRQLLHSKVLRAKVSLEGCVGCEDRHISSGIVSATQVDCTPPGNILAKVVKFRASEGNYIGFALMAVAGEGTIARVEIRGQARSSSSKALHT